MSPNTGRSGRARGFWSPPNILSLSRIAAVPFIYWGFAGDAHMVLYTLIGCAFLTDAADGFLARRFRWESKWGLVLDPLADKILVGSLSVFLVLYRDFPLWAAALIIVRDLSILGAGAYLYFRPGNVVLPADRIGKLTTLAMGGALILYAVDWQPYGAWALWAALCCVAGSGIHYVLGFTRLIRERTHT
ncbi:MAG: CDP-alcohol phosphatidyltransferase family protein [Gemmatimonadetes bacterium]|nr:CDP-alcohol phosphatidyltransferase family protein [Gemmatimonadota bacterium]